MAPRAGCFAGRLRRTSHSFQLRSQSILVSATQIIYECLTRGTDLGLACLWHCEFGFFQFFVASVEPAIRLSSGKLEVNETFLGCYELFVGFPGSVVRTPTWTEVVVGYSA